MRRKDKHAACEGKQAFDSPKMANRIMRRKSARRYAPETYRCEFCGKWHLGSAGNLKRIAP